MAQLVARYVRDVEAGSSSLLTPTIKDQASFFNMGAIFISQTMADNYLENQYEQYLKQKAAKEAAKRAVWRKRLQAYKEKLKNEKHE